MHNNTLQLTNSYVCTLLQFAGLRALKAGILLFLAGIFQGISLLLLIPLLGVAGFRGSGEEDRMGGSLQALLERFDISYGLPSVLGVFLAVIATEALFTRYRTIVLNALNLDFTNHLRKSLYRSIGSASWQYHSGTHSSESVHLLDNAVSRIGDGTYYALQIFVLIFQALVFLFVASSLSMSMTVVMLATGFILYVLLIPLNKKVFSHGEKAVNTSQALYRNMGEFFGGLKLAKSYNRTDAHTQVFEQTGEKLLTDEKTVVSASAAAQFWLRVITVSLLCLFVYLALTIMEMSIEKLLVLIVVVNRLYGVFSQGQNYWQALLQALPSFAAYQQSIQQFHQYKEPFQREQKDAPRLASHLYLENISFRYGDDTDNPTLSNITATFPAKTTSAITGESGSGKSTLVDIIMGLLVPDSGHIYADGLEITADRLHGWRDHIAYVPQEVYLFDGTIRSNLEWISDNAFDDEDIWAALDAAAAGDFIRKLPAQLDTKVGERGVQLSGGERQRIALARALLKKPGLLILDEATSSLDLQNEERIRDALSTLHGSLTIIIIAHRKSAIEHADIIVALENGRLLTN